MNHLRNHIADYISWYDETSRDETYHEWLKRPSDSTYYVNGLMMQATKTGNPLIIFHKDQDAKTWQRICAAAKWREAMLAA